MGWLPCNSLHCSANSSQTKCPAALGLVSSPAISFIGTAWGDLLCLQWIESKRNSCGCLCLHRCIAGEVSLQRPAFSFSTLEVTWSQMLELPASWNPSKEGRKRERERLPLAALEVSLSISYSSRGRGLCWISHSYGWWVAEWKVVLREKERKRQIPNSKLQAVFAAFGSELW